MYSVVKIILTITSALTSSWSIYSQQFSWAFEDHERSPFSKQADAFPDQLFPLIRVLANMTMHTSHTHAAQVHRKNGCCKCETLNVTAQCHRGNKSLDRERCAADFLSLNRLFGEVGRPCNALFSEMSPSGFFFYTVSSQRPLTKIMTEITRR